MRRVVQSLLLVSMLLTAGCASVAPSGADATATPSPTATIHDVPTERVNATIAQQFDTATFEVYVEEMDERMNVSLVGIDGLHYNYSQTDPTRFGFAETTNETELAAHQYQLWQHGTYEGHTFNNDELGGALIEYGGFELALLDETDASGNRLAYLYESRNYAVDRSYQTVLLERGFAVVNESELRTMPETERAALLSAQESAKTGDAGLWSVDKESEHDHTTTGEDRSEPV